MTKTYRFKYKKGMGLSYERQGYIYFMCRNWNKLTDEQREKIKFCADNDAAPYGDAVLYHVTTGASLTETTAKYFLGINTLYRALEKFYKRFPL